MKKRLNKIEYRQGALTVYMAFTVIVIMTVSTLVLTDIVARQFRSAVDVEFTERAFYAASSGLEHAFYLVGNTENEDSISREGEISYNNGVARYKMESRFRVENNNIVDPCIFSEGEFRNAHRRMAFEVAPDC